MHQTASVEPAISGISRRLVTDRILTSDQARDAETDDLMGQLIKLKMAHAEALEQCTVLRREGKAR